MVLRLMKSVVEMPTQHSISYQWDGRCCRSDVVAFDVFAMVQLNLTKNYHNFFESTKKFLNDYEDFNLQFSSFCQDDFDGFMTAVENNWPGCAIILCWLHIKRTAISQNYRKSWFTISLKKAPTIILHIFTCPGQLPNSCLKKLMFKHWRAIGETD